eukprot:TRINITY_DN66793_c11_g2_i2.p1 TRINITY_DN66793_c11_g2~~TRINITY_DN66793_c11_g2_i2.p1  ORF type:complete len:271 (-),score=30.05 TRINITY_DN66793_c11_g2_i2:58-870(-)
MLLVPLAIAIAFNILLDLLMLVLYRFTVTKTKDVPPEQPISWNPGSSFVAVDTPNTLQPNQQVEKPVFSWAPLFNVYDSLVLPKALAGLCGNQEFHDFLEILNSCITTVCPPTWLYHVNNLLLVLPATLSGFAVLFSLLSAIGASRAVSWPVFLVALGCFLLVLVSTLTYNYFSTRRWNRLLHVALHNKIAEANKMQWNEMGINFRFAQQFQDHTITVELDNDVISNRKEKDKQQGDATSECCSVSTHGLVCGEDVTIGLEGLAMRPLLQ